MPDETPTTTMVSVELPDRPANINPPSEVGLLESLRQRFDSVQAFGLPDNSVRALIAISLVFTMLAMLFASASKDSPNGKVPDLIITAAGIAAGFYLTGEASATMKALLSLVIVFSVILFLWSFWWVPESLNGLFSTVMGIYFRKAAVIIQGKADTVTTNIPEAK